MKIIRLVPIICVMLATHALASPQTQPSNTIRAERVIHFDASPQKREEVIETIQNMNESLLADERPWAGARIERAAEATVDLQPQVNKGPIVSFSVDPPANEITVSVSLQNRPDILYHCASEAADEAVRVLIQSLTPPTRGLIEQENFRKANLTLQQNRLEIMLSDFRDALHKQSDSVDVSSSTIRQLLSSLQTQSETASLDLVAKQARSDALTEQVAKFSDQLRQKTDDDPVAQELQKIVEFRQKTLEREQNAHQSGAATEQEVDEAVANLAEARAKLLERKAAAADAAGGDVLAAWNKELMNLAIDMAELRHRSKAIDERLNQMKDADELLRRLDQAQANLDFVEKQLMDVTFSLLDLESKYAREHIDFSITSRKDTPAPATQPAAAK